MILKCGSKKSSVLREAYDEYFFGNIFLGIQILDIQKSQIQIKKILFLFLIMILMMIIHYCVQTEIKITK